jgi:hypothetical protein
MTYYQNVNVALDDVPHVFLYKIFREYLAEKGLTSYENEPNNIKRKRVIPNGSV